MPKKSKTTLKVGDVVKNYQNRFARVVRIHRGRVSLTPWFVQKEKAVASDVEASRLNLFGMAQVLKVEADSLELEGQNVNPEDSSTEVDEEALEGGGDADVEGEEMDEEEEADQERNLAGTLEELHVPHLEAFLRDQGETPKGSKPDLVAQAAELVTKKELDPRAVVTQYKG